MGQQLDSNISELQVSLKELESIMLKSLDKSMAELKKDFGLDLTPLMPKQDDPEED